MFENENSGEHVHHSTIESSSMHTSTGSQHVSIIIEVLQG